VGQVYLEVVAFTIFLYGRMIGCAAEIDDHIERGRNMDTRAPSTRDLGANAWAIGASYSLSKRTELYAFFTRVDNDDLASYTFGGAAGTALRPGVGFENNGVALGIRHGF
jgi:predicted porin